MAPSSAITGRDVRSWRFPVRRHGLDAEQVYAALTLLATRLDELECAAQRDPDDV